MHRSRVHVTERETEREREREGEWVVIGRIIIRRDKLVKTIMIGQARVYEFSSTFADTPAQPTKLF